MEKRTDVLSSEEQNRQEGEELLELKKELEEAQKGMDYYAV